MTSERYFFTAPGFSRLSEELRNLKANDRHSVIRDIAEARGYGDLSENAEYHAAKERQNIIENRISYLEKRLANAEIIDIAAMPSDKICFGATVVLIENDNDKEVKYQIVGEDEADIKRGLLSHKSLLAKALLGREKGETFILSIPAGEREYHIKSVEYVT